MPDPAAALALGGAWMPAVCRADDRPRLLHRAASAKSGMLKLRRTHVSATRMMPNEESTDVSVT